MGARSSLESLDPRLLGEIEDAYARGATIDDVVERLREAGHPRSRSAVGRYTRQQKKLIEEARRNRANMRLLNETREEGETDDAAILRQIIITSMAGELMKTIGQGDDADPLGTQAWQYAAKALHHLSASSKIDADRAEMLKKAARDAERARSAEVAAEAARGHGATEDMVQFIRAEILGLNP